MCRTAKLSLFLLLSLLLPFAWGCGRNDFFPRADLVIRFEDANISPTSLTELPVSSFEVVPLNGITSTLKSYSISYATYLGEAIPALAMENIPLNIRVAGAEESGDEGEEVSFELRVYTERVRDLLITTSSQISPIIATISITYEDIHSNTGVITTYANIFKPEVETADEP
jgi:hypothetical protein